MTLFSVRGTAVRISPLFWVCALLWIFAGQGTVLAASLIALLFHETAHIAVANLLDHPVESVTLYPFGGAAIIPDFHENASHAFLIAASGPLASLLLGFVIENMTWIPSWDIFAAGSYALAVFNLLPICPLDGGQALLSIIEAAFGSARGGKIMAWSSMILSSSFLLYSLLSLIWRPDAPTLTAAVFLTVSSFTELRRPHLPFVREKVWKHADRVCWRKVYLDEPLLAISRTFGGSHFYMLAVADRNENVRAVVTEKDVLDALFQNSSAKADELLKTKNRFIP